MAARALQADAAMAAAIAELSLRGMAAALAAGADRRMRARQVLLTRRPVVEGSDADSLLAEAIRLLAPLDPDADPRRLSALLLDAVTMPGCGRAVVTCLTDLGADVHARDDSRSMALHRVCRPDAAAALIAAGADVGATDSSGRTPLHTAAYTSVIEVLLAAGADPCARDYEGRTPLFYAHQLAWQPDAVASAQRLLDAGADPTITSAEGTTAADEAVPGLLFYSDTWLDPRPDNTREAATCVAVIRLLLRATAWHRRRHLLLAVRGRRSVAREAAAGNGVGTGGHVV